MTKTISLTILLLNLTFRIYAQEEPKTLKVDINNNKIIDVFRPTEKSLEIKIDNKQFSILYEELGFEHLSDLRFENNVLTFGGYMEGTGMYSPTYKFRNNKITNKIELIGYEYFYKWPTGNFNRSYNALTQKYEITIAEYIEKKEDFDETVHSGKFYTKKIILTELKNSDLYKLDEAGKQFEKE